jgi:hypothetical protein
MTEPTLTDLFAKEHIRRNGLSSLAIDAGTPLAREVKRALRNGKILRMPDTVWPRHWRYYPA